MLKAIRRRVHLTQREDGFTLVELIVAMVILAGVLMTLIAVQISAAATIIDARKREQATAVGNEAMEQLRAIPWAYLSKGMYNGFDAAAGDDPHAAGNTLTLPSGNKVLIVASAAANQDLAFPRPPLFDTAGSNKLQTQDAAESNTLYSVWSYVAQPVSGAVNTVDLVVIVEWTTNKGKVGQTILQSTAFRGTGCGDETVSPFLAACQAFFQANSTSGQLSTLVSATTYVPAGPVSELNLLYPTSDSMASLVMRSAGMTAGIQSQQTSIATAGAVFGGTTKDDADPATEPPEQGWTRGYDLTTVSASDDKTQNVILDHVGTTNITQASNAENPWVISDSGTVVSFSSRSDYRRPTTAMASTTTSCKTGVPANQPCAIGNMGNNASIEEGSGYLLMYVGPQIIRLSRRLAESAPPGNADEAWVARFKTAASTNAAVGCNATFTGAGCVSAGATRTMAKLSIGFVVPQSPPLATPGWSGAATEGLVVIEGTTGCTAGFTESVMAQRGSHATQKTAVGSFSRCGQVRWWSGGAYSTAAFSASAAGPYSTAPVTWTDGTNSVTAYATVTLAGGSSAPSGSDLTNCQNDACGVAVQSGSINIVVTYDITTAAATYSVISVTTVDGPTAQVTYKEAPSA